MKRNCLAALAAMTVAFAPAALAAPTKVSRCRLNGAGCTEEHNATQ